MSPISNAEAQRRWREKTNALADIGRASLAGNGAAKTKSLYRALAAMALGQLLRERPLDILERAYPNDHAAALITRAASSPTTTTTGADLLGQLSGSFLSGLAPQSAAARLFAQCVQLDFSGVYQFFIPYASTSPAPVFVGEGLPFPVAQGVLDAAVIGPVHKMLLAVGIVNQLEFVTFESATAIIGRLLSEQATKSLDTVLLDGTASSATRSAGLLNGVSTLGATSGGGIAAMSADLGKIANAIGAAACDPDRMVVIASPAQAVALRLLSSPNFTNTIIGTPALAAGTIVGVDPKAIATGFSGVPTIETSREATIEYEDTSPTDITTGGVAAGTVRSAFQTDTQVLRVRTNCCWGLLATGAVQFISSTTW
jgi:hypothetical protein